MMTEQEKYEWIEAFLEGRLTSEQQAIFALRQKEDPDFAREVEEQREIQEALGPSALDQVRQLSHDLIAQNRPPAKMRIFSRRAWWGIAASLLLLLLAGWWLYSSATDVPDRLFSEYYTLPAQMGMSRSEATPPDESDASLQNILDSLYQREAYTEMVQMLETKGEQMSAYASADYYYTLGVLYLQIEEPAKAIQNLEKVTAVHLNDKDWYLALAALKLKRLDTAKDQFATIARSDSPYRSDARKILSEWP